MYDTSVTRSRITGNARIGVIVSTARPGAKVSIRVRHISRRSAVDLGGARAALAGLAVPAAREVGSLGRLETVHDVEDDLTLGDRHDVLGEFTAGRVTHARVRIVTHLSAPSVADAE